MTAIPSVGVRFRNPAADFKDQQPTPSNGGRLPESKSQYRVENSKAEHRGQFRALSEMQFQQQSYTRYIILESLCYWPPEYFKNEKSELALANIWSLGITLIELVSGSVPYRDKNGKVPTNIILLQNMIINLNTNNTVEDHFNGYSEEIKNLVKSCLEPIEERLNHEALKNNDFLKNYRATGSEKLVQDIIKKYHQVSFNVVF